MLTITRPSSSFFRVGKKNHSKLRLLKVERVASLVCRYAFLLLMSESRMSLSTLLVSVGAFAKGKNLLM